MIALSFFNTVEFFVIMAVIAAAVVAYMCIPSRRGEAVLHTVPGELLSGAENTTAAADADPDSPGTLTVRCREDGSVELLRRGLGGLTESGAVSLAVTVIGFDVSIEERRSRGYSSDPKADAARFVLDFLAPEWYHVRYAYSEGGEFCSFQLHVKPGIKLSRKLKR